MRKRSRTRGSSTRRTDRSMTFVPEEDEHGYAAAEAGWDDEEAYGEEEPRRTGGTRRPARRRRRRWRIAIAAATVAVLAIAAAVFLLPSRTSAEPFRTYANTGADSLHAEPPESWTPREGTPVTRSCRHDPMRSATRFLLGSSRPVERHPPASSRPHRRTRWACTSTRGHGLRHHDRRAQERHRRPRAGRGSPGPPTHRQLTIGGSPADELEGVVQDPTTPTRACRCGSTSSSRPPADRC